MKVITPRELPVVEDQFGNEVVPRPTSAGITESKDWRRRPSLDCAGSDFVGGNSTAKGAIAWRRSASDSFDDWARVDNWADHGLRPALKTTGIYDPESIALREAIVPQPAADLPELSIDEIVRLTGDAARGKNAATRCLMCHAVGGTGAELGPSLDGWGRGKSADVIARAWSARALRSRTATKARSSARKTG